MTEGRLRGKEGMRQSEQVNAVRHRAMKASLDQRGPRLESRAHAGQNQTARSPKDLQFDVPAANALHFSRFHSKTQEEYIVWVA